MTTEKLLTIAVICKNEAANIERCLESVLKEGAKFAAEILVVDSFSTDGTIELAGRYPVTILQLGRDWPHSPAAGRHTAVRHATGRYLLLIDGDMELLPGFLELAVAQMDRDPSVAAVRGRLHNYLPVQGGFAYCDSKFAACSADRAGYADAAEPVPISCASGSALFRLGAARDAGNFHPYLKAEEEYEFALRLRAAGGRLLYLPVDAVNHYGYLPDPLAEVGRRLRRGLVGGAGQVFRLSLREGYAATYLWRIRQHILVGMFFLSLGPALLTAWFSPLAIQIWLGLFVFLTGAYWWKMRALKPAFAALLIKGIIGIDIFKGVFAPLPERGSYPTGVTIMTGSGKAARETG